MKELLTTLNLEMDIQKQFEETCQKSVQFQLQTFLNRFILQLGDLTEGFDKIM